MISWMIVMTNLVILCVGHLLLLVTMTGLTAAKPRWPDSADQTEWLPDLSSLDRTPSDVIPGSMSHAQSLSAEDLQWILTALANSEIIASDLPPKKRTTPLIRTNKRK